MPIKIHNQEPEIFLVKIIRAFPGNRFLETRSISFTSREAAYTCCDDIQYDLDGDCDPARSYVLDKTGMAIRAGLARSESPRAFFASYPPHLRRRA